MAAAATSTSLLSLSSALKHCSLSSPSQSPSPSPSSSFSLSLKPSPPLLAFALRRKALLLPPVAVATETDRGLSIFEEEEDGDEELRLAYEALYGPAFSGLRKENEKVGRRRRGGGGGRDEFEERVVEVKRVTKVVKGGKQLSFRAVVVVGDKKGQVGVGVGSAKEVVAAVQKSSVDAKRHIIAIPLTKARTFPHRAEGKYGAAKVMLRPAATGTGVIAGGSVRVVLEMAGVENALGKEIGSKNALNNARAVIEAISQMKTFEEVSIRRGIPMEELWK